MAGCESAQGPHLPPLDDLARLQPVREQEMLDRTLKLPDQIRDALQLSQKWLIPPSYKEVDCVVVAGMGGSAIGGMLASALLEDELPLPMTLANDYEIPAFVNDRTLFFAVSYSGDTSETLSAYEKAKERRAKILCIASNGKLLERAEKDGFPHLQVPQGFQPRSAIGYLFVPLLVALSRLGLCSDKSKDLEESAEVMESWREELSPECPTPDNFAKQLATHLHGKVPVIFAPRGPLSVVAYRWKTQINENAKAYAITWPIPEANHNEIEGWRAPEEALKNFASLFLHDPDESPSISERMAVTKEFAEQFGPAFEIWPRGESKIARALSLVFLGDLVSLYLAALYGVVAYEVKRISILKERISKIEGGP